MKITQTKILVHHLHHQHLSLSSCPVLPLTVHIIHHTDILGQQSLNIIPLPPAKTQGRSVLDQLLWLSRYLDWLSPSPSTESWLLERPKPNATVLLRLMREPSEDCGKAATANGDYRDTTVDQKVREPKFCKPNHTLPECKPLPQWLLKTDFESPILMKLLLLQCNYWILTITF